MAAGGSLVLDQLRFLRSWLTNPRSVGAVAPSGPDLTRRMAAAVEPERPGVVVELGPGTGVVTAALLERGIAPGRIVAVEYGADFVELLRARFPEVATVRGDAYALRDTLAGVVDGPVASVVSSLPLLTSTPERRIALMEAAFAMLPPGAPFVQFSYGLRSPVPDGVAGMRVETSPWIWRNVPPARVWTYRRG